MTDYVITNGRSEAYPLKHYGAHFTGSRATFCLDADFAGLDANVLTVPNLPVSVLSASPVSVGGEFFGMQVNRRANDSLTGVTAAIVRNQDMENGRSRWLKIEYSPGLFAWSDVDSWVNTHYAAGRELVFVLWGTPQFYSARPSEIGAYGIGSPGASAEPSDMAKWSTFCTKVAQRYAGKIKYYDIWNEPNYYNDGISLPSDTRGCYFTGTFAKLSEMVRRANQAIKAVDPTAKIICPATTVWQASGANTAGNFFTGMMAASTGDGSTTMKDWVDIVGVHLYLPYPNKVQDLAGMIDRINEAKTTAGVLALPTWDTESAPIGPDVSTLTDDQAKAVIGRSLITMAAKGISRTIYYQYDNSMGFMSRSQIAAYREQIVSLLRSGTMLNASRFADGRVGYYTNSGLTII